MTLVEAASDARTPYPHLFSPIKVGTMQLRNRVMMPPHASAIDRKSVV